MGIDHRLAGSAAITHLVTKRQSISIIIERHEIAAGVQLTPLKPGVLTTWAFF
jgi:hypothetical protein